VFFVDGAETEYTHQNEIYEVLKINTQLRATLTFTGPWTLTPFCLSPLSSSLYSFAEMAKYLFYFHLNTF